MVDLHFSGISNAGVKLDTGIKVSWSQIRTDGKSMKKVLILKSFQLISVPTRFHKILQELYMIACAIFGFGLRFNSLVSIKWEYLTFSN